MSDLFSITEPDEPTAAPAPEYTEEDIESLDWREHIRLRPGMYIGKLGNGDDADDGIYVLLKEVMDNSLDEFIMGHGHQIDVTVDTDIVGGSVSVRDYGRGIPLGSVVDVASKINTGGKYREGAFAKTVGLNGVGIKAVNALSSAMEIISYRGGRSRRALFSEGILVEDDDIKDTDAPDGTLVRFTPDASLFKGYRFLDDHILPLIKNYTYLHTGLAIVLNGVRHISRNGLKDLLAQRMSSKPLYDIIHLKGKDIEMALTHTDQYGEEFYSFVNGQYTPQGGTHQSAFKEAVSRTIKEYFGRNFEFSDIRNGMVGAVSISVSNPVFDSQTKTKLNSRDMGDDGPSIAKYIGDFVKKELDNYLHRDLPLADVMLQKIQKSERDRREVAGVAKKARETAKKVSLYNRKLNDCRVHLNDTRGNEEKKLASSIFIVEGDSAGGSIEKARDVETQAVFKLRGKPLNSYGASKKELYTNEEFSLLQAALNIEDSIDGLRYNNVIIATDADVDGMHIRLLMLTFFLQYFPDLIKKGHVYVLQTPLFRVRNGKTMRRGKGKAPADDTVYCYNDEERVAAIHRFGDHAEITRFKGLGEISHDEFRAFIGPEMRVDRVSLRKDDGVDEVLEFYMGKNTMERQNFIIDNLVIEDDREIDRG